MITLLHNGCVGLIGLGFLLIASTGGQAQASPPVISMYPTVISSPDGLLIDWRAPEAVIAPRDDGTVSVLLPGYLQTAQHGAPQLPFISVLVAVPPGAVTTLRKVAIDETDIPLPGSLALAPLMEGVKRDESGRLIGGDFSAASSVQPAQSKQDDPVILEPAGVARGVSLARLVFYPVRPVGSYPQAFLRVTTHVSISITFSKLMTNLPRAASSDPSLAALRSAVINPEQVQPMPFAASLSADEHPSNVLNSNNSASTWVVEVTKPGMTALTYEALEGIGFPVASTDPQRLHLARAGTEIAAEWYGNDNTRFEPGERLLFYAEPRFSRWTATDVYFLWQDSTPGLRMQNRSSVLFEAPRGIAWADETAEVNKLYTPDCFCGMIPAGRDGDHWVWDDLKRPGHSTSSYSINLPGVDAAQPAMLTVWLIGYTAVTAAPDHRVEVALDGTPVGQIEWDGKQARSTVLTVPPGILHNDVNTLTLTLPGIPGVDIEGAWLDAFSIHYALGNTPSNTPVIFSGQPEPKAYSLAVNSGASLRIYDITNPDRPFSLIGVNTKGNMVTLSNSLAGGLHTYALVTESEFLSPAAMRPLQSLQSDAGFPGADYILIAPEDFIPALDSLIALRQTQGLIVAVENVQAIYDTFGDGRPDPEAIRAYLAHAYAAWTPRPTFVVLVGDGSFDPRLYRAGSPPTFIPPYLADVDPWAGETAADNRYVTVDGQDTLPDMLIGRLPVKTLAETQTVVDKIVQYETNPYPGGWNQNVTFIADNSDEAGNFSAASEAAAAGVTSPFTPQQISFNPPLTTIPTTQQVVLDQWNTGAFMIQFTGHSSWQQWASERFFHLDDLPALRNLRRLPVVIEMTCLTSAFQRPEPTLDEALLTLKGAGAVATWGATGLGISTGHSSLDQGFIRAVFSSSASTVGQATWAGKLSLASTGQYLDLLDTYTLLGDPALKFNRTINPWASWIHLPIVMSNQSLLGR